MGITATAYARMLFDLLPPGRVWPAVTSTLRNVLLASADELERIDGRAADIVEESDPSTATELLTEYERQLGIERAATDEERRARIVARLVARQLFRPEDFRQALAPLLAQDPADVVVLERTAAFAASIEDVREIFRFFVVRLAGFTDDFPSPTLGSRWISEPRQGAITLPASTVDLDIDAGDDARWDATHDLAVRVRTPVQGAHGLDIRALRGPFNFAHVGVGGVMYVLNSVTGDALIFGGRKIAAPDDRLFWRRIEGGVMTEFVGTEVLPNAFRMREMGDGNVSLEYNMTATDLDPPSWTVFATVPRLAGVTHCGVAAISEQAPTPTSGNNQWDKFRVDPGTYFLQAAQELLDEMKPSHTVGHVIESLDMLYDDPFSLYDRDLMGV